MPAIFQFDRKLKLAFLYPRKEKPIDVSIINFTNYLRYLEGHNSSH
jgi:hypothetical protein